MGQRLRHRPLLHVIFPAGGLDEVNLLKPSTAFNRLSRALPLDYQHVGTLPANRSYSLKHQRVVTI
jgi:hypothetical protein